MGGSGDPEKADTISGHTYKKLTEPQAERVDAPRNPDIPTRWFLSFVAVSVCVVAYGHVQLQLHRTRMDLTNMNHRMSALISSNKYLHSTLSKILVIQKGNYQKVCCPQCCNKAGKDDPKLNSSRLANLKNSSYVNVGATQRSLHDIDSNQITDNILFPEEAAHIQLRNKQFNQNDPTGFEFRRRKRSADRGKKFNSPRGGKQTKQKRGKRKPGKSKAGPVAAHFKGVQPEVRSSSGGSLLAPWFLDEAAVENFTFASESLKYGRGLEIGEPGLYLIYAQVYYLTSQAVNSFSINHQRIGEEWPGTPVAFCSASAGQSNKRVVEVSCFTSVVRSLKQGDQLYLRQIDRNRTLILRDGYSFLGIVRLNTHE